MMTTPSSSPPKTNNLPLIRASELAHYGFCRRSWWLRVVKKMPLPPHPTRTRGLQHHQHHARQVQTALRWRRVGISLLMISGLLLVALWLLGGV